MITGSLKEIVGLHEDGVTARRRKAMNRARKDPNTNVGFIYDGDTKKDYYTNLKKLATNKERKQINELLSQMSPEQLNQKTPPAAYDYGYDVYAVRKNNNIPYLLNIRGDINYKHPVMKHEAQHRIQQKTIEAIAKQYDRKANQKRSQLLNTISDYKANFSSGDQDRNYDKNSYEFEANMAGVTRNPHPGMSTVRIARNALGKSTPKKEFIPSAPHGDQMNKRVDGQPYSLQQRIQNNINDKAKGSQDRLPTSGQSNMNREKYNKNAQDVINSVTVASRRFNPAQLDSIKGMSKNPEMNKSKNFPKLY